MVYDEKDKEYLYGCGERRDLNVDEEVMKLEVRHPHSSLESVIGFATFAKSMLESIALLVHVILFIGGRWSSSS